MRWTILWQEQVINAAVVFLQDDPDGFTDLLAHIDQLETSPRPDESSALGSPDLRRLRIGRYRVMYEVAEQDGVINVIHMGRLG